MLRKTSILGSCIFVLLTFVLPVMGTTYYVDPNGSDEPNGGDANNPFATIEYAIEQTTEDANDLINVAEGIYYTGPITLKSNLKIVFEEGTTVKIDDPNNFPNGKSLFLAKVKDNIEIEGYGVTFELLIEGSSSEQQRHAVALLGCTNISISGLTITSRGGDGILISQFDYSGIESVGIEIKDVICDNNARNGIAICSGQNILVDNCSFMNTHGILGCGVDLEPYLYDGNSNHTLKDITFKDCSMINNTRTGISVGMHNLTGDPNTPCNITFERCFVSGPGERGVYVAWILDDGPNGQINFNKIIIENVWHGIGIESKAKGKASVNFTQCLCRNILETSNSKPILISNWGAGAVSEPGNITFSKCQVMGFDVNNREVLGFSESVQNGFYDVNIDLSTDVATSVGYSSYPAEPNFTNCSISIIEAMTDLNMAYNLDSNDIYEHIQDAIDNAIGNDEIEVFPGTYTENVNFDGKNITLKSSDPTNWDVVVATIIDANGAMRGVDIDTNSVLSGFTITGGTYGVYSDSADPVISKCVIEDNNTTGVYCNAGAPAIENCEIYDNSNYGIHCNGSAATIKNNWIYRNGDEGIRFAGTASPAPMVRNNTIAYNTNHGVRRAVGNVTSPTISNCILWANDDDLDRCSATYSCIEDSDNGTGNIDSDPCFVNADANDFHLEPDSPCIDAGHPSEPNSTTDEMDIDGELRVVVIVDMGADEVVYPISHWKMDDSAANPYVASLNGSPTELVKNGTFEDDSEWVFTGTWSWHFNKQASCISPWQGYASQIGVVEEGKKYMVLFEVPGAHGEIELDCKIGGTWIGTATVKGEKYVMIGTAGSSNSYLQFEVYVGAGASIKVDNVYCICLDDFPLTGIFYDDAGDSNTDAHSVAGKINTALEFDGINDYVDCGNDSSLDIGEDLTVQAWVKLDSESAKMYIAAKDDGTDRAWGLYYDNSGDGQFTFEVYSDTSSTVVTGNATVDTVDWYHVVATYKYKTDGSSVIGLYVDGVSDGSTDVAVGPIQTGITTNVNIGRRNDSTSYFHGKIDDVRIYNQALLGKAVEKLYQNGLSGY